MAKTIAAEPDGRWRDGEKKGKIAAMKKAALLLLLLTTTATAQSLLDDSMARPETKAAFKAWKPGPNVQAALDDLTQQGRDLLARFRDGQTDERTMLRERKRREIAAFTIKAWAFTKKTDDVASVAVITLGSSEINIVFPMGLAHLPKQLQPGSIYLASPTERRQWQFVGQREGFAIFRRVE